MGLNTTGNASLTASGAITESGSLTVGKTLTVAAGAGNDISLDTGRNHFGTIVITSGDDVALNDAGTIILGALKVTGGLSVTAGDSIIAKNDSVVITSGNGLILIAGGTIGSSDLPVTFSSHGGPVVVSAGKEEANLSVSLRGNVGSRSIIYLIPPPGLILYNNSIQGGENTDFLLASSSSIYGDFMLAGFLSPAEYPPSVKYFSLLYSYDPFIYSDSPSFDASALERGFDPKSLFV